MAAVAYYLEQGQRGWSAPPDALRVAMRPSVANDARRPGSGTLPGSWLSLWSGGGTGRDRVRYCPGARYICAPALRIASIICSLVISVVVLVALRWHGETAARIMAAAV